MYRKAAATLLTVGFACAAPAWADRTAVVSFRDELVRISDVDGVATIETFTVSDNIRSLHKDAHGNIYGVGRAINGQSPLYLVENALNGTPSLSSITPLGFNYSATVRKGDQVFAFNNQDEVWSIDVSDLPNTTETLIGNTGISLNGQEIAGAAIDLENDILYGGSSELDALYEINQTTGQAELIGELLGSGNTVNSIGMDFDQGTLFATIANRQNNRRELGTVDTNSGAFTALLDLGPRAVGSIVSIGMVIVPEPGSLLLLSCCLLGIRRR